MIKFIRYGNIYLLISSAAITVSIASLILWGLKPSIDFTGGALYEFKLNNATSEVGSETIKNKLSEVKDLNVSTIQYSSDSSSYIIRTNSIDEGKRVEVKNKLKEINNSEVEDIRFETVGPTLGRELLIKTLIAVILASIGIMIYVAYQFKKRSYGVSAILAMVHDTVILLGVFSLLGKFYSVEVDTLFVTALLTTLSFSVHDTIVVFDRIRESIAKGSGLSFESMVDKAITDTLPRSLNNSLTIIFMLTCLVLLGGATIKWFVVALLIGTISGTYSSPFVATPLLYLFTTKNIKIPRLGRKSS